MSQISVPAGSISRPACWQPGTQRMTSRPPLGLPPSWTPTTSPPTPTSLAGTSLQLPAQLLGRPARRRGLPRDQPRALHNITPQMLQTANCKQRRTFPFHQALLRRQQTGLTHSQQTLPCGQQARLPLLVHTLHRVPPKQRGTWTLTPAPPHRLRAHPPRQQTPDAAWQRRPGLAP